MFYIDSVMINIDDHFYVFHIHKYIEEESIFVRKLWSHSTKMLIEDIEIHIYFTVWTDSITCGQFYGMYEYRDISTATRSQS